MKGRIHSFQNCHGNRDVVLPFLKQTEELRVRHVVVPGLTDREEHLLKIAETVVRFSNLKKLELLPFRMLCLPKYRAMALQFPLESYDETGLFQRVCRS